MESKTKKKIITITLILLVVLVVGTGITVKILDKLNHVELPVIDNTIKGAPEHYMFYFEESYMDNNSLNVYDELGNKVSDVKVDLIVQKVNKKNELETFTQKGIFNKPTKIKKINNRLYAIINGDVYTLSRNLAPQKVMASLDDDKNKFIDFSPIGLRNELVLYSKTGIATYINLAARRSVILNAYTKEEKELYGIDRYNHSLKDVLKLKADKDGVYILSKNIKNEVKIERYLLSPQVDLSNKRTIIEENVKDFTKVDDWIYYVTKDNILYRVFKDGTQKTKVAKDIKSPVKDTYNADSYMCGYIDTIYYIDKNDKLNSIVVKINEKNEIAGNVKNVRYEYGYIYYTTKDGELYCININTNETIKLREGLTEEFLIINQNLPN